MDGSIQQIAFSSSFLIKWANQDLFFYLFSSFKHITIKIKIDKSVDGVLGIWTQGGRMEGADESTELRRHPFSST